MSHQALKKKCDVKNFGDRWPDPEAKLLGIGTAKLIDIAIAKANHDQEKMDSGKYKCIVNVF